MNVSWLFPLPPFSKAHAGAFRVPRCASHSELKVPLVAAVFVTQQLLDTLLRPRIEHPIGVPRRAQRLFHLFTLQRQICHELVVRTLRTVSWLTRRQT